MRKFFLLLLIPAALLLVTAAACGDDDDDDDGNGGATTAPDGDGEGTDVAVTLQEFNVIPNPTSAAAGTVNFNIQNDGPDDPHEFVVIKTDLAADALPTAEDGSVDEEGEGIEVVDEVEDLEVGGTETLTVDLEAGAYVLICNITEEEADGTIESHYQEGMHVGFTVE
jgi:uncharacterized cupredoxin-like copper-binding protein